MRLGESQAVDIPVISTGSLALDIALGVGGLPRGRIVEIYGPEASGKTTPGPARRGFRTAQRRRGGVSSTPNTPLTPPTRANWVSTRTNLLISQPDSGEQGPGDRRRPSFAAGPWTSSVVDSVAALVPQAEIDGDMGEPQMGLQARLMSQAMRKLTGIIHKTKTCVIFINQIRQKIGVFFGSPGDDDRRQCPEVLCFRASRHSPHRLDQIRSGSSRQPHPGQDRQKQGGPAFPAGRVRRAVRYGNLRRRRVA